MIDFETDVIEEQITDLKDSDLENNNLIVWNDEVNTFENVIKALIEICKLPSQEAVKHTFIIHFMGKSAVKSGHFDDLRPLAEGIIDRGINATIE